MASDKRILGGQPEWLSNMGVNYPLHSQEADLDLASVEIAHRSISQHFSHSRQSAISPEQRVSTRVP